MEEKYIYVVVHANGRYSEYMEYVVGVTDSYTVAVQYANKEAEYTNNNERWYLDLDTIEVRKYRLNKFKRNLAKAESMIYPDRDNVTVIWKVSEDGRCLERTNNNGE